MNNNPYSNPYVHPQLCRTTGPIITTITEVMATTQAQTMETRATTIIPTSRSPIMAPTVLITASMARTTTLMTTSLTRMQLIAVRVWELRAALAVFCRPVSDEVIPYYSFINNSLDIEVFN